jgi:glycosyltransferase involved in cell wall biosynthesis
MTMAIVAVIPAFNEGAGLASIVRAVRPQVHAVVVVDDGSSDDTAVVAERAGAVVLRHEVNRGKGAAMQTALEWARSTPDIDVLVFLDGDGQHDPVDLPRLVAAVRAGADIVVGSRFLGASNAPLYRVFGLHVLSASAAIGSGIALTDSQSGYRAISRRAIDALRLREPRFGIETEMQFEAARAGLAMTELPIEIRYTGPARRSPVAHGISVLIDTVRLTAIHRPARFLLLVATPFIAIRLGLKPARAAPLPAA